MSAFTDPSNVPTHSLTMGTSFWTTGATTTSSAGGGGGSLGLQPPHGRTAVATAKLSISRLATKLGCRIGSLSLRQVEGPAPGGTSGPRALTVRRIQNTPVGEPRSTPSARHQDR